MVNSAVQYRRALKKKLRCNNTVKERLLEGFDQTLATYLEENNSPTTDDLITAFGPPEQMAEILMAEVSPQEQIQYRKNILSIKILTTILAVVLAMFTLYTLFVKEFKLTVIKEVYEATTSSDESYSPVEEGPY